MQSSHVVFISAISAAVLLFQFNEILYFLTKHLSFFPLCCSSLFKSIHNGFTDRAIAYQLQFAKENRKKRSKTLKSSPSTLYHQRHMYTTYNII